MNVLTTANSIATMTSREIAELTKKPHDNVLKLVRSLIDGGIVKNTTPHEYIHPQNKQTYIEFFADKRDSLVIVSRLSPEFTAAVVDRWQELESQSAFKLPDFTNPAVAARAWADEVEQKMIALAKIQQDAPKVAFAEAVRAMEGACEVGAFAKAIGTGRNKLFKWMREQKYLMVTNYPYQQYIERGLFVVVEQTPYTDSEGKSHPAFKTLITGKGQVWLESKYHAE